MRRKTVSAEPHLPLRLGVSGSSFIWAMPPGLFPAAIAGQKYDAEQNRLMVAFMREMMAAICDSSVRSLECYHTLAWEPDAVVDVMLQAREESPDLEFWAVHAPYGAHVEPSLPDASIRRAAVEACAQTIKVVKRLGAGVMVVHPGADVSAPLGRCERLKLSAQTLTEIADLAAAEAIQVAIEPLPKREVGNTIEELIWIMDNVDRPNMGACVDTNHLFPASCLPRAISNLGPRLLSVHASDHDGAGERHWLPMQGVVDWSAVLQALREVDYRGPLICEVHGSCGGSCAETIAAIEASYTRLETVIEKSQAVR